MIRIYIYDGKILFLENANSPIGDPIGIIIQTAETEWSLFPDRFRGYTSRELKEIIEKIDTLNNHIETKNEYARIQDADIWRNY